MGIPVAVPGSALTITEGDNTLAEALLTELVQIIKNGTSGASITTPGSQVPDPSDPKTLIPLELDTAAKQLFLRHIAVVMAKSLLDYGGGGGGGGGVDYSFAENETPSGSITGTDGTDGNDSFTIANTPVSTSSIILVKTRAVMLYGVDFTISDKTITYLSPQKPIAGEWHRIWYRY